MTGKILKQLKKVSEQLDILIRSASSGMRTGDLFRYQKARKDVQEAISQLLEIS